MIHWALILRAALAAAVLGGPGAGDEAGCRPSYLELSSEEIVVRFHPSWEVTFNGVLIGCRGGLERIDPSALAAIQERLRQIAKEKHFNFYRMARRPEFRAELCRELNGVVRDELVSDIYFHTLGLTEYRPVEVPEEAAEAPD